MSTKQSIALEARDVTALTSLTTTHPGVSMHLVHLAVFRLGLGFAAGDPTMLAEELAAISAERRERRRQARTTKIHGTVAGQAGQNGGSHA
jgi:hypothetical protein